MDISGDPIPSTSSATIRPAGENFEEALKMVRQSRKRDRANIKNLSGYEKLLLKKLREQKELQFTMLPDAPIKKKLIKYLKRQESPLRHPCRLMPGVPVEPPARRVHSWKMGTEGTSNRSRSLSPCRQPASATDAIPGSRSRNDQPEQEQMPPSQKKRRQLVSPSTAPCTPVDVIEADVEFIGFTPSSATTEVPGPSTFTTTEVEVPGPSLCTTTEVPGTSPMSPSNEDLEQMRRDLLESSDDDDDGNDGDVYDGVMVDVSLRNRTAAEFPNFDSETLDMDAANDTALRQIILNPQLLHFEWSGQPENFEGSREVFTGQAGPTFDVRSLSPLNLFEKIWDAEIMARIVYETNTYAKQLMEKNAMHSSRISRWKDINIDDLWTFFAIMFLHSLVPNNVEREYWYPRLPHLKIGDFGDIMSYDHFLLIKRCLHFTNNLHIPQGQTLAKINPIITHLNAKFSSLYLPEQNIALDESLLLWKGKLTFAQAISTKKARVGIKSFEICESRTGYLWKMDVYAGKNQSHSLDIERRDIGEEQQAELEGATAQIVLNLARPLFKKGHTLVMDNFYNSPLLTRLLKVVHRTDTMGTLRLNREFVPVSIKERTKNNLRAGEMCSSCTKDISIVSWRDKNLVTMISSFHPVEVGGKEKFGVYKYKPQVILDYNQWMGGVDKKDQMLHAYPIERVRNLVWYKKLFRRLLNVSIHNSFVIFNTKQKISNREFRMQLVEEILKRTTYQRRPQRGLRLPPASAAHVAVKAMKNKRQRCKLCATNKKRTNTPWTCKTCNVHLCIPCFEEYHK